MRPTQSADKPVPLASPITAAYWEGCLQGELLLQRCASCGAFRHPPSDICPKCLAVEHAWVKASGKGSVFSFVVVRQALDKVWASDVPYCVAIVALEEGPHVLTTICDVPPEDVAIGMPVEVFFERVNELMALPKFRPSNSLSGGRR